MPQPIESPQPAPAPPQQQSAPPPRGKVLFERHTSAADSAVPATEAPADPKAPSQEAPSTSPQTIPGISSSTHRTHRQGLQRRTTDPAEATGAPTVPTGNTADPGTPPESGISSSLQTPGTQASSTAVTSTAATVSAADQKASAAIPDADRSATRILSQDLDLHLNQHTGELTARARISVRNDGAAPLARIPLQISSALQWQSARFVSAMGGASITIEQHRLLTDADHTGAVTEAAFPLPNPLAPGETASLDLYYGGTLAQSAERLLRLGAPTTRAALSDWDTVSDDFTGLRGFGNVLWFPSSSPPILLADGASFVQAVEADRTRNQDTRLSLRLTLECAPGSTPEAAFFHGDRQPLVATKADQAAASGDESLTLSTAQWNSVRLGAHPVTLFIADAAAQQTADNLLDAVTEHADTVADYSAAAERLKPLLTEWLGPHPAAPLHVLDLPLRGAQPFADGSLLVIPMQALEPKVLAPSLVYPLSSAWLPAAAPPWLRDGLPEFLRLLYLERTEGRDAALVDLNASGDLLARQEGFSTETTPPLDRCADSTCARTKAAYVFTMLRQITGDDALKQALTAWRSAGSATSTEPSPATSTESSSASSTEPNPAPGAAPSQASADSKANPGEGSTARFERVLSQASGKDLAWFFHDWIDHDPGLPDLQIVSIAPRRVERATVNNTVPTERRPTGGPIGPEPVPQPGDPTQQDRATEASRNRIGPAEGSWLVAVEVRNNGGAAAEVPVTVRSGTLQNVLPLRIAAHSRATIRVPFETVPEEVWVNDGTTPEVRSVTHHRTIEIPAQYQ